MGQLVVVLEWRLEWLDGGSAAVATTTSSSSFLFFLFFYFSYLACRGPNCWTAAFAAVWQLGCIPSPAVSFSGCRRVVAITMVVAGCCWARLRLSFFFFFFFYRSYAALWPAGQVAARLEPRATNWFNTASYKFDLFSFQISMQTFSWNLYLLPNMFFFATSLQCALRLSAWGRLKAITSYYFVKLVIFYIY